MTGDAPGVARTLGEKDRLDLRLEVLVVERRCDGDDGAGCWPCTAAVINASSTQMWYARTHLLNAGIVDRPESFPRSGGAAAPLPGSGALLAQKLDDRVVLERLRGVERRAAVGVGGVDVDAELDGQLDRFERQRFALLAARLAPRPRPPPIPAAAITAVVTSFRC